MSLISAIAQCALELLAAAVLLLNIFNLGTAVVLQLNYIATFKRRRASRNINPHRSGDEPFISVHVPCYDEPAPVVIETLLSLANLDYSNFEVIVLDNNTPLPETWAPVKRTCDKLGERFRFFHFDIVKGAKAGALNLGLGLSAPQTRYVAIVDADYQVLPDFLSRAVDVLRGRDVAFVQFPQAYRNVSSSSSFIEEELSDYFRAFAPHANSDRAMLLTGTLSVIDIDKLRAVGGWSGDTVTEDAELGVRLFENGFSGLYDPTIVGRGLLPMSYESLQTQRRRWAIGNLQTLAGMMRRNRLDPRSAGFNAVLVQLTAWPAYWLIPVTSLMLFAFTADDNGVIGAIQTLSASTILFTSACIFGRFLLDRTNRKKSLSHPALVFVVKLSLVRVSSTAFIPVLWKRSVAFLRTPKLVTDLPSGVGRMMLDANLIVSLSGAVGILAYGQAGHWVAACACVLVACIAPSAIWVNLSLRSYAKTATMEAT